MKGQKKAVVDEVQAALPGFNLYKDIALVYLTRDQLEGIKLKIGKDICNGLIEYGKDKTNEAEVMAYARSMVMNHLKKARELNGNQNYNSTAPTPAAKPKPTVAGVDVSVLPEDLADYVKNL